MSIPVMDDHSGAFRLLNALVLLSQKYFSDRLYLGPSINGLVTDGNTKICCSVGAKSQILSSVAPPRKKNLVTIFSQGHVLGPWKPMFY